MTGIKIPVFERGNILTQEMLDAMKSYAVDAICLSYDGYSDGVIRGCEITTTESVLTIHRGLIYYKGNVCFLTEELQLSYEPTDQLNAVKLVFGELSKEQSFVRMEMYAEITNRLQKDASSIELARFRLQPGAILRTNHRNLQDYETEYDTLSCIEAEYSAYGEASLCPELLWQFAKEADGCDICNGIDMAFLLQIWNMKGETLNRKVIERYVSARLEQPMKTYTNKELFDALVEALRRMKQGKVEQASPRRSMRMIID